MSREIIRRMKMPKIYNPIDDILDSIDIKYLEKYIRIKKLKQLNNDTHTSKK